MEGEGVESFCLIDDEFKILVRNANVDIKEAIENGASGIRGETGVEREIRESSMNTGAVTSRWLGLSFRGERGAGSICQPHLLC